MSPEPILEAISRKEQELRARLIQTRARAEGLVRDARLAADQLRADGEAAAAADVENWLREQEALLVAEAEAARAAAETSYLESPSDGARLQAGVDLILDAVLLRRSRERAPTRAARPQAEAAE